MPLDRIACQVTTPTACIRPTDSIPTFPVNESMSVQPSVENPRSCRINNRYYNTIIQTYLTYNSNIIILNTFTNYNTNNIKLIRNLKNKSNPSNCTLA